MSTIKYSSQNQPFYENDRFGIKGRLKDGPLFIFLAFVAGILLLIALQFILEVFCESNDLNNYFPSDASIIQLQ